jgi:L-asparagine oxygenase
MRDALERDGYVVEKKFCPNLSTLEVARVLGSIVNIPDLLPNSGIPIVQSIRPRETSEVGDNQYSGHYGLSAFPIHTDLAHWILPPRYLLLRCLVGSEDIFTTLIHSNHVERAVGAPCLQKAVLRIRKHSVGSSGLVRAISRYNQEPIFRWDPVFLQPLNRHAYLLKSVMLDPAFENAAARVLLQHPGDTLVIDNWRMFHGRSQVPARSVGRRVERVYLSEVRDES